MLWLCLPLGHYSVVDVSDKISTMIYLFTDSIAIELEVNALKSSKNVRLAKSIVLLLGVNVSGIDLIILVIEING